MRYLTAGLFLLLLAAACKKKDQKPCEGEIYTYSYEWYNNATIDTTTITLGNGESYLAAIKQGGNRLVFRYERQSTPCPGVMDGVGGAVLLFDADPSVDQFSYSLTGKNGVALCYIRHYCLLCPLTNAYIPKDGSITGQKRSAGKWSVQVDIPSEQLRFTADFNLK